MKETEKTPLTTPTTPIPYELRNSLVEIEKIVGETGFNRIVESLLVRCAAILIRTLQSTRVSLKYKSDLAVVLVSKAISQINQVASTNVIIYSSNRIDKLELNPEIKSANVET